MKLDKKSVGMQWYSIDLNAFKIYVLRVFIMKILLIIVTSNLWKASFETCVIFSHLKYQKDPSMDRKRSSVNMATISNMANFAKMITFEEFCNRTSLHGWKYLGDATTSHTWLLRVGWVAVVFGSMAVAAFFLGYSLNDFCSSTTETTQGKSR